MSNLLLRKLLTSLLYVVLAVVIEFFMFASFGWGVFPSYPLFDIALIMFIGFLIFACRTRKGANTFVCIVLGVQMLVSYLNIIMMSMLNDVFAINMLVLVGETAEVVTFSMFPWAPIIFLGIIIAILTFSLIFLGRIPVDESKTSIVNKYALRFAVLFGMALSMGLYTMQGAFIKKIKDKDLALLGDNYLYNTFSSGKLSIRKFGTYCFYIEQISRAFVDVEKLNTPSVTDLEKYLSSTTYDPKDSALWNAFAKNGDNNLFLIMAESFEWYAISPEITPVLYALANGYDFGKAGELNSKGEVQTKDGWRLYEMYDFKNNNTENRDIPAYIDLLRKDYEYNKETNKFTKIDGSSYAYDPNLENSFGLTMINYYSKAKTDYSEDSAILGNYPYNKSFVTRAGFKDKGIYQDVNYYFSLPNMLKDSGYINDGEASYFHTYMKEFYGRKTLIPQFGFDNATFYDTWIQNPNIVHADRLSHAILDSQVMSEFGNMFVHRDENGNKTSDGPWLSFFTTVTTHGEYSTYNPLLNTHYAFIDSVDYAGKPNGEVAANSVDGQVRTYLAGCLDTEYMVAHLLDYLIRYNEFSNTTIVFFADHNAYYENLDMSYKAFYYDDNAKDFEHFRSEYYKKGEGVGKYGMYASERYAVPCFMYATDLDSAVTGTVTDEDGTIYKRQYIEKFTCTFDILPSLITMCGIEYNTHYYLGYPIMCPQTVDDSVIEQGSKLIASHTGGYFNNRIFSEDGLAANYMVDGVTAAELRQFSKDANNHLEKWYLITALYDKNAFEKAKPKVA